MPKSVTLTWNDTGATSYDLYYSTSPTCDVATIGGCPGGSVATGVTSPHTLTLTNGLHYTFWLAANRAGGHSTFSESGARPDRFATNNQITTLATGPLT